MLISHRLNGLTGLVDVQEIETCGRFGANDLNRRFVDEFGRCLISRLQEDLHHIHRDVNSYSLLSYL